MPFTQQEFMQVFARYNQAIWPTQVAMYVLAAASLFLISRKTRLSNGFAGITLTIMWVLAGAGYHIGFFSAINPIAYAFGTIFLLQALLLLFLSVRGAGMSFEYERGAASWAGWCLVAYAMVFYPLLGGALGHRYPEAPVFGVAPCPITIFTFGMLLWSTRRLPRYLLVIPAIWSLVGFIAASRLGVYQDYGLFLAGLIAVPLILRRRTPGSPAPVSAGNGY